LPLLSRDAGKCTGGVNARYFCNRTTRTEPCRHLEGDLDRHGGRAGRIPRAVALGTADPAAKWNAKRAIGVCKQMRMPLFSYFAVVGVALTLALLFISSRIQPLGSPVPTSQIVGIAKPFKPEPERSPYTITGTNFAAAYKPASARATEEPKPVRR